MKTIGIVLLAVFGSFLFLFLIGVAGKVLLWGGIIVGVFGVGRLLLKDFSVKSAVYESLDVARKRQKKNSNKKVRNLDIAVLSAARKNDGMVSPADVAMEAECKLDRARKQLDQMVDKGHVELRATKSGNTVYVIPSLLTKYGQEELEPLV
ncbi:MAG: hypothetical protein OXQ31_09945 [Spirochaetaceae bacterium]|nr:hypothetical protein [Spirochaetaceae bacterium]